MLEVINLQLFAEGGDAGAAGSADSGAQVAGGNEQSEGQVATDNGAEESFEDLIKGRYKKDFDARVQDIISKRFKNSQAAEDNLAKMTPMLNVLGQRYGIDTSNLNEVDFDKLANSVFEDNSYFEAEALEKGMDVNTLKQLKKMEMENNQLRAAMQQRQQQEAQQQAWNKLVMESEKVKQLYPSFDLASEMENPKFGRLVAHGVDARTAYEVIHRDEIQAATMQFTAQKTAEKISNAVMSNNNRVTENGIGQTQAAETKLDPSKLTKAQREEIRKRVSRGEKITF